MREAQEMFKASRIKQVPTLKVNVVGYRAPAQAADLFKFNEFISSLRTDFIVKQFTTCCGRLSSKDYWLESKRKISAIANSWYLLANSDEKLKRFRLVFFQCRKPQIAFYYAHETNASPKDHGPCFNQNIVPLTQPTCKNDGRSYFDDGIVRLVMLLCNRQSSHSVPSINFYDFPLWLRNKCNERGMSLNFKLSKSW